MTKVCSRCKEEKPLGEFGKNQRKKDGLSCSCKLCERERDRRYREENREKRRENDRRYEVENREYRVERNRILYAQQQKVSHAMATKTGRWTQEEEVRLIDLRKTKTIYQCAIELGRGYASTAGKILYLRKKGFDI